MSCSWSWAWLEQRYRAVCEVLDGATVTDVARRNGVARQTVHGWLRAYADGGMAALVDRSSRPRSCPHEMPAVEEARIVELRRANPQWGPARSCTVWPRRRRAAAGAVVVHRALVRHGVIHPTPRRRRRADHQRSRPWAVGSTWPHPSREHAFETRRVKNDRLDARPPAGLLRLGRLPEAWTSRPIRELHELVRRHQLVEDRAGLTVASVPGRARCARLDLRRHRITHILTAAPAETEPDQAQVGGHRPVDKHR